MANGFDGTVAVVTGAAAGIGRATAAALAAAGARVAVADLDPDAGEAAAQSIRDAGGDARFFVVDVSAEESVRVLFLLLDDLGPLRILVNCAGGSRPDDRPVDELDPAVFDATIARDLRGTMLCARSAIPRMRVRGGGSIVNFASYVALGGASDDHAYIAAKGGVISLTRAMAARYAQDGIRVNAIAPGIVLTDRVRQRVERAGVDLDEIKKTHPFAVGDAGDVARIALFLAGDDSSMITGCIIPADGGLTLF